MSAYNLKEIVVSLLLNNHCYIQYNNKKICVGVIDIKELFMNYAYYSFGERKILPVPILRKAKLYKECDVDRWLYIEKDLLDGLREYIRIKENIN